MFLLLVIFVTIFQKSSCQENANCPSNPCSNFEFSDCSPNSWAGNLTISPSRIMGQEIIRITFDEPVMSLKTSLGAPFTRDRQEYEIISDLSARPQNMVNIDLLVRFGSRNSIPELKSVTMNDESLCYEKQKLKTIVKHLEFLENVDFPRSKDILQINDFRTEIQRCLKFIENSEANQTVNATLTIPGMKLPKGSDLKLTFFRELTSVETETGEVCTRDHKNFYISDINRKVKENEPLDINFILNYDQAEKPELKEIYIGRKWFCTEFDSDESMDLMNLNMTEAMTGETDNSTISTKSKLECFSTKPTKPPKSTTVKPTKPTTTRGTKPTTTRKTKKTKKTKRTTTTENPSSTTSLEVTEESSSPDSNSSSPLSEMTTETYQEEGNEKAQLPKRFSALSYPINYFGNHPPNRKKSNGNRYQQTNSQTQPFIIFRQVRPKDSQSIVEHLKSLGPGNTFYNYFGETQYIINRHYAEGNSRNDETEDESFIEGLRQKMISN